MRLAGDVVRPLSGEMFKLESQRGALLGTITVPLRWADILRQDGSVTFPFAPPVPIVPFGNLEAMNKMSFVVHTGHLCRSHNLRDAVMLWGLSLEQFEQIHGCSFSPSAAYLRSIVE